MNTFLELRPPLESFPGILAFLRRFAQVCVRTMPFLLIGSAVVGVLPLALTPLSPMIQQAVIGGNLLILFLLMACLIAFTTAFYSFVATAVSVAIGWTTVPLGQALTIALRRLPRVIGYSFVALCAFVAGFMCLILPGIYLGLRLFPITLVALFEPNVNALKRSWEITRYRTLEVFISYLLILVITLVPSLVIGLAVGFLPPFPGSGFLSVTLTTLLSYSIPFVFWLLLYGWFRADIYEAPVTRNEELYAET